MAAALPLRNPLLHYISSSPPDAPPSPDIRRFSASLRPKRRRRGVPRTTAAPLRYFSGLWRRREPPIPMASGSDESSAPFEMSFESALKVLGVAQDASFDEIVRAKNAVLASCKDDVEAAAQVEAAYDMLLMQSLSQRRAGKVAYKSVRYADVKNERKDGTGRLPQWLQATMKNAPVSIEVPSTSNLGIQAGTYGALMVLQYVNGTSTSTYASADVPGIILGISFGASLYFLTKKNIGLGKATIITVGGLVVGAAVGSAVEQWLQVDIVPFLGIHSPAVVISEFILLSQFLVSLYVR